MAPDDDSQSRGAGQHWPPRGPVLRPDLVRQGPAVGIRAESDGIPVYGYGYTYVYGVSPTFVDEGPVQSNNPSPMTKLRPKQSWEIESSMLGATPPRMPRAAPSDLQPFLDWGFMISFSGILTYSGAKAVRDAAALVPLEQCLIETDAPWLAPAPHKTSDLNEPAFIVHTAKKLAKVKGTPFDEVAAVTTANAHRFFGLQGDARDTTGSA